MNPPILRRVTVWYLTKIVVRASLEETWRPKIYWCWVCSCWKQILCFDYVSLGFGCKSEGFLYVYHLESWSFCSAKSQIYTLTEVGHGHFCDFYGVCLGIGVVWLSEVLKEVFTSDESNSSKQNELCFIFLFSLSLQTTSFPESIETAKQH